MIVKIDYDEPDQKTYRCCYVSYFDEVLFSAATNDPVADWETVMNWLLIKDVWWMRGASCDHFVLYGDLYEWNQDMMLQRVSA